MDAEQLRAAQAPLKQQYKDEPAAAVATLTAESLLVLMLIAAMWWR